MKPEEFGWEIGLDRNREDSLAGGLLPEVVEVDYAFHQAFVDDYE